MSDAGLPYADALAELEQILDELEAGSADVDALTSRVARAAELIALCRDRIGAARLEIEQIVAGLEGEATEPAGEAG